MPGRDSVLDNPSLPLSLALVSLPSGFSPPPLHPTPPSQVRCEGSDEIYYVSALPYTRVCLDTDVLGSDFRDHLQRRFAVLDSEKKKNSVLASCFLPSGV